MPALPPLIYAPPQDPPLILHRDEALLIVEKPAGLLSVPGRAEDHRDCLQTRLETEDPAARLVHRLDLDTSGVMVFARSAEAQRHLSLQFERRHVRKEYEALVGNPPALASGEIDAPIRADWPNRPLQMIATDGRKALTRWTRLSDQSPARLRLEPHTGRSHQLRVHLAHIGHPILGDRFYVGPPAVRLMLHATQISLRHPIGGAEVSFSSPCPF